MKNTYSIILLLGTLFILNIPKSKAQSEGYIQSEEVPKLVQQKMNLLYPNQDKNMIIWEIESGGYEAYLKNKENPNEEVVFFSAKGNLEYRINTSGKGLRTGTEKEIDLKSLPESVIEHSKGKAILAIIELLDLGEATIGYRLYLDNGKQLNYDSKGTLISSPEHSN